MERRLVHNVRDALQLNGIDARVWASNARVWVCCFDSEDRAVEVSDILSRVMGIVSVSPVAVYSFSTLDELVAISKEFFTPRVKDRIFAVRVHRKGEHSFTSKDVERVLGKILLEAGGKGVDLENPEVTAYIEVRDYTAYLFDRVVQGPGGLPIGVEGRVLGLLLSRESLAAVWMVMKRGCEADVLIPQTDGKQTRRLVPLIKMFSDRWAYGYEPKLFIVDIGHLVSKLSSVDAAIASILLRKFMLRISQIIAREVHAEAIVSDESFYSNSLHILRSLDVVDEGLELPVLRPLIALDRDGVSEVLDRLGLGGLSQEEHSLVGLEEMPHWVNSSDIERVERGIGISVEEISDYARRRKEYSLRSSDLMNLYGNVS